MKGERVTHPVGGCFADAADMNEEWTFCPFCGGRLARPEQKAALAEMIERHRRTAPRKIGAKPVDFKLKGKE
jgi:uncharacterized protein with PIN domain